MLFLLIALVLLACFGTALLLFDTGDLRADDPSRFHGSDFPITQWRRMWRVENRAFGSPSHYLPMGQGIHRETGHIMFAIDGMQLREVL